MLFRVLQGLAGGGLQPSSQGVLLDAFPPEKQGQAMTLFGVAALLAPVVGPTLGGYITDNYGWRWIFYLNMPVGLLALALCSFVVVDPDYLKAARPRCLSPAAALRPARPVPAQRHHGLAGKSCSAKGRNGIGSAIRSSACRRCRSCFARAV